MFFPVFVLIIVAILVLILAIESPPRVRAARVQVRVDRHRRR